MCQIRLCLVFVDILFILSICSSLSNSDSVPADLVFFRKRVQRYAFFVNRQNYFRKILKKIRFFLIFFLKTVKKTHYPLIIIKYKLYDDLTFTGFSYHIFEKYVERHEEQKEK